MQLKFPTMKVCTRANVHSYRNVAECAEYGTQLLISELLLPPVKQAKFKGSEWKTGEERKIRILPEK